MCVGHTSCTHSTEFPTKTYKHIDVSQTVCEMLTKRTMQFAQALTYQFIHATLACFDLSTKCRHDALEMTFFLL